jgi:hypothetical protein
MPNEWSQLARQHWVIGGIFVSLLWFFAGKQSLSNKRPDAAIFWQAIGAVIILILCGWAVANKQWLGVTFGLIVLFVEARSIKRIYAGRLNQRATSKL